MRKAKKVVDFSEPRNAQEGHNTDDLTRECVGELAKIEMQMTDLRGQKKDILNRGKDGGILKMALKAAVKELLMSEEKLQAKKEIDEETRRITELCADLPLFQAA